MILSSPACRTLESSWNHHHSRAMSWMTHSTWHIMIMQPFTREYRVWVLILSSIQQSPSRSSLISIGVIAPLWLSGETEVISSTTCVIPCKLPPATPVWADIYIYIYNGGARYCVMHCVTVYYLRGLDISHVNDPVSVRGREISHVNHGVWAGDQSR